MIKYILGLLNFFKRRGGEMDAVTSPGPTSNVEPVDNEPKVKKSLRVDSFLCAGPRKSSDESTDFSEDAGGFVQIDDMLVMWVLDGTSHTNCLRKEDGSVYFSSRILAHRLSYFLSMVAEDYLMKQHDFSLEAIFEEAMEHCIAEFKATLQELDAHTKQALLIKIKEENNAYISTTLALASLNILGEAKALKTGDSSIVIHQEDQNENVVFGHKTKAEEGRIHILIVANGEELSIKYPPDAFKISHDQYDGVSAVLLHTDGIGKEGIDLANHFQRKNYAEFRRRLPYIIQKPDDDMTLMVAQVLTFSDSTNDKVNTDENNH